MNILILDFQSCTLNKKLDLYDKTDSVEPIQLDIIPFWTGKNIYKAFYYIFSSEISGFML